MEQSLVECQRRAGNYIEINKNIDLFFSYYSASIVQKEIINGQTNFNRNVIAYIKIGTPIYLCSLRNEYLPIDRTNYLDDAGWSEIVIDIMDKTQENLRPTIYNLLLEHMPAIESHPYTNTFSLDTGECVLQESAEAFKGLETLENLNDLDAIRGALKAGFIPYDFAPHLNHVVLRHQSSNVQSRITENVLEAFNHLDDQNALQLIQNAANNKMDETDYLMKMINPFGNIFRFDSTKHTEEDLNNFKNNNLFGSVIITTQKPKTETIKLNGTLEQQLNLLKMFGISTEAKESTQN